MNTKTTLVMALLAAVIAGYIFLVKPWDLPKAEKAPDTTAKGLFAEKPKDIDGVELTNSSGTMVFKKQDNVWTIVQPLTSPAAEYEVNALVDRVGDLKYLKEYAAGDKDRPKDSVSGLDKPVASVRLLKGDKVEAELIVGKRLPTGRGTYVKLAGSDKVYESQTEIGNSFTRRLTDFRDKRVLKFELKDVKSVKVEGLQNFELSQAKDEWIVEAPTRGRADKAAAEKVVRPLSTLSAQDFKDDKPISLKPYGLDRPRLKVAIKTSREVPPKAKPGDPNTQPADTQPSIEDKTHVLLVGGATDLSGTAYFAKLESAPWVFSLQDATVKDLAPAVGELRDKQIVKIDSVPNVTQVEADTPGGRVVLSKSDKGVWTTADGSQADTAAVEDLIKAVQNLRASGFVDENENLVPIDWSKPRAKVTLTKRGEANPVTLLVGQETTSGKMVHVRNAAERAVAVVREGEIEQLLAPPVAYQDRMVLTFPREHANRLEIVRGGGPAVVLTKTAANTWAMVQPIAGTADADAARNLVADLSSLRAKRVVDSGNKEKYNLLQPAVSVTVQTQAPAPPPATRPAATQPAQPALSATQPAAAAVTQPAAATRPAGKTLEQQIAQIEELLEYQRSHPDKENPKATEMLKNRLADLKAQTRPAIEGAPQSTQPAVTTAPAATQPAPPPPQTHCILLSQVNGVVYACRDDRPTVYELDKKIFEDASAEMFDRQIMRFDVANVTELGFEHGDTRIELRKSGSDWKYVTDPMLPIDSQKVTDVLNAFRDLKTHRYVAYKAEDLAKYGLDKNVSRVRVVLNDGQKHEILLSKSGPDADADKSQYAVVAGTNRVFLLKGDQAGKFAQKLEDFEKGAGNTAGSPTAEAPDFRG